MKKGISTNTQVVYNQENVFFLPLFYESKNIFTGAFSQITLLAQENLSIIYANIRVWIQGYFVFE